MAVVLGAEKLSKDGVEVVVVVPNVKAGLVTVVWPPRPKDRPLVVAVVAGVPSENPVPDNKHFKILS